MVNGNNAPRSKCKHSLNMKCKRKHISNTIHNNTIRLKQNNKERKQTKQRQRENKKIDSVCFYVRFDIK